MINEKKCNYGLDFWSRWLWYLFIFSRQICWDRVKIVLSEHNVLCSLPQLHNLNFVFFLGEL